MSRGNGRIDNPFDLATALASPQVGPGDTLELRAGTYAGNFTASLVGRSGSPITLRPYPGEVAVIDGTLTLDASCRYLEIRDLEITQTGWVKRDSDQLTASPTDITYITAGLTVNGSGHRIVNCYIHDHAQGLFSGSGATNLDFIDCLWAHNGWKVNSGFPANAYGHGIYPHNATGSVKRWLNCLFVDNLGYNVHMYGNQPNDLNAMQLVGCTTAQAGAPLGAQFLEVLNGGTEPLDSPLWQNNCFYGIIARLGWSVGNTVTNARLLGNLIRATGAFFVTLAGGEASATISGNTVYTPTYSGDIVTGNWPGNIWGTNPPASGQTVVLRPSPETAGRANLTIFNWDSANTVSVDVSSVVPAGQPYTLTNAQDPQVDIASGTVAGNGTIAVDMRAVSHSVAAPALFSAAPTTFPTFGAFVLEAA